MTLRWNARLAAVEHWRRLNRRDRHMLVLLGVFVLGVSLIKGVWLPTQQRLEAAERVYRQNLSLAERLKHASSGRPVRIAQSLSRHVSESAAKAGLDLSQLDNDSQGLSVTLEGDAKALLNWLIRLEQDGARMQSLTLEKREALLLARVAWAAES
ncbi:type II secretion system protein GspM [Pseudomonas sp. RC10]|uniref:type II secretion system protein GspM n=1 Tax=Pseudomonas bambusae TaxID=3139142 RepID=UPI0031387AE8